MTAIFPTDVLLAGASNAGLADAEDGAARALLAVSPSLLCLSQYRDYQVALRAMLLLLDEIGPVFLQAHQKLYRDEAKLREMEAAGDAVLSQYGIMEDFDDFKIPLKVPKAKEERQKRRA